MRLCAAALQTASLTNFHQETAKIYQKNGVGALPEQIVRLSCRNGLRENGNQTICFCLIRAIMQHICYFFGKVPIPLPADTFRMGTQQLNNHNSLGCRYVQDLEVNAAVVPYQPLFQTSPTETMTAGFSE
jgi:hypothetical protein